MSPEEIRTLDAFLALGEDCYVYDGTVFLATATLTAEEVITAEGQEVARIRGTLGDAEIPIEFDLPQFAPAEIVVGLAVLQRLDELLGKPFASPRFTKWMWPARRILRGDPLYGSDRTLLADWLTVLPKAGEAPKGASTIELLESIGFQAHPDRPDEYEYAPISDGPTYVAHATRTGLIDLFWSFKREARGVTLPSRMESLEELHKRIRVEMPMPLPKQVYAEAARKVEQLPFWREHTARAASSYEARCVVSRRDLSLLLRDLRDHLEDPDPASNAVLGFDGDELSLRVKGKRCLLPAVGSAWAHRYRVPALAFCWTKEIEVGLPEACTIAVADDLLTIASWAVKGVSVYNPGAER